MHRCCWWCFLFLLFLWYFYKVYQQQIDSLSHIMFYVIPNWLMLFWSKLSCSYSGFWWIYIGFKLVLTYSSFTSHILRNNGIKFKKFYFFFSILCKLINFCRFYIWMMLCDIYGRLSLLLVNDWVVHHLLQEWCIEDIAFIIFWVHAISEEFVNFVVAQFFTQSL